MLVVIGVVAPVTRGEDLVIEVTNNGLGVDGEVCCDNVGLITLEMMVPCSAGLRIGISGGGPMCLPWNEGLRIGISGVCASSKGLV